MAFIKQYSSDYVPLNLPFTQSSYFENLDVNNSTSVTQFIRSKQQKTLIQSPKYNPYNTRIPEPVYEKVPEKYSPFESPYNSELTGKEPIWVSKKLYNGLVYKSTNGSYNKNRGYTSYKVT